MSVSPLNCDSLQLSSAAEADRNGRHETHGELRRPTVRTAIGQLGPDRSDRAQGFGDCGQSERERSRGAPRLGLTPEPANVAVSPGTAKDAGKVLADADGS